MDFYENKIEPKPAHGTKGEYREFIGQWSKDLQYSGDRLGCDIYCASCNHWNTVKGTGILFEFMSCKNCGTSLIKK